jgi:NADH:ubiquinone oxidoreductase subunit K
MADTWATALVATALVFVAGLVGVARAKSSSSTLASGLLTVSASVLAFVIPGRQSFGLNGGDVVSGQAFATLVVLVLVSEAIVGVRLAVRLRRRPRNPTSDDGSAQ